MDDLERMLAPPGEERKDSAVEDPIAQREIEIWQLHEAQEQIALDAEQKAYSLFASAAERLYQVIKGNPAESVQPLGEESKSNGKSLRTLEFLQDNYLLTVEQNCDGTDTFKCSVTRNPYLAPQDLILTIRRHEMSDPDITNVQGTVGCVAAASGFLALVSFNALLEGNFEFATKIGIPSAVIAPLSVYVCNRLIRRHRRACNDAAMQKITYLNPHEREKMRGYEYDVNFRWSSLPDEEMQILSESACQNATASMLLLRTAYDAALQMRKQKEELRKQEEDERHKTAMELLENKIAFENNKLSNLLKNADSLTGKLSTTLPPEIKD